MRRKTKSLETLNFQGFSSAETRGIRTPDNLIKRHKINSVFMRICGQGVHLGVTPVLFFAIKKRACRHYPKQAPIMEYKGGLIHHGK